MITYLRELLQAHRQPGIPSYTDLDFHNVHPSSFP